MAREALEGVLEVDLEHVLEVPEPRYKGGYPMEVSPNIAFAMELRKARAGRTQENVQTLQHPFLTNWS